MTAITALRRPTASNEAPSATHDFNIERALLAACLMPGAAGIDRAYETLDPRHFADPLHGRIFEAMAALSANGQQPSPFSLAPIFQSEEPIVAAGGALNFFSNLGAAFTHLADAPHLAQQIVDYHNRRQLAAYGEGIVARALNPVADLSVADDLAAATDDLNALTSEISSGRRRDATMVRATPYSWTSPVEIAPRQWLHRRHFIRGYLSVTVSAGGVGKSSQELIDACSMAAGRDLLNGNAIPPRRVWYWNGEDPHEELQRRVQATALHYRLTMNDLADRLFIDSGRDQRIEIAREDRRNGFVMSHPHVDSIVRTIIENRIDVLIVDPFVSTHGVPENDNNAIDRVAKEFAAIAQAGSCAVEAVHHVRKSNGAEITAEDARGAVALIAAARSVRVLNPMTADEAVKAGIKPRDRRSYFRIDFGKANMAPMADGAEWRRLVSVGLGNGEDAYPEDHVGVVTAWKWPDAFAGMTSDDLREVQNKIHAGRYRESVQAADWVGVAIADVLGLDLDDAASKQRVKTLVRGWLESGALKVVDGTDDKSRKRKMVEVGTWAP